MLLIDDGQRDLFNWSVYDGLTTRTADGKIVPDLATEWKADGTKWIFTLRPNVKFHDGTDFNADAVKFTYDRLLDPNSPYADTGPFPFASGYYGSIAETIVVDPLTVQFRLKRQDSAIVNAFGLSVTSWLLNDRFFGWPPIGKRLKVAPLFGRLDIDTPTRFYAYSIVILVIVILLVRGVRRSRTGRVIVAMRENERAAQSFSIAPVRATCRSARRARTATSLPTSPAWSTW